MAIIIADKEVGTTHISTHQYNTVYILGISFISALGGYLFGFDFAVISGALPFLQRQFEMGFPGKLD